MNATINEALLKKYVYHIKTFESNIKSFNKNAHKNKGFLINVEDYEELKKKIKYKDNKNLSNPRSLAIDDKDKIMTIKDLEFKTNQYLINMLLNGNKYILVDGTFWKIICDKGKENSPTTDYEMSTYSDFLNLKLKDQKPLKFDNTTKDNILEISKLKDKSGNNFELIKKIFQNIK